MTCTTAAAESKLVGVILLFYFEKVSQSVVYDTFEKIFPDTSRREMGLKLSGLVGGLFSFGISFTVAFFQGEGKYPA